VKKKKTVGKGPHEKSAGTTPEDETRRKGMVISDGSRHDGRKTTARWTKRGPQPKGDHKRKKKNQSHTQKTLDEARSEARGGRGKGR